MTDLSHHPATIGAENNTVLSSKEWIWLTVSALGLLLVYLSPLREHLTHLQEIKSDLMQFGHFAPLAFIVAMTVITAAGVPRMLLYPIGGMAFGFKAGLAWSMVGTVAGAYLTFLYARWAGRGLILKKWPALARMVNILDGHGIVSIALFRQIPGPGFLTNLLLGISPVSHSAFLGGTLIGCIPSAIPAILIGSSLTKPSEQTRFLYVGISLLVLVALWLIFGILFRRSAHYGQMRAALKQEI